MSKQAATAESIMRMDSRKLLNVLNDSAQAKIAFFENHVKELGNQINKHWRLAALHARELFIEDVDTHTYYHATHTRDHGQVKIAEIKPIQIIEEKKNNLFAESCRKLIDSIEENDAKGMGAAFNRMKVQRFTGRTIPYSGNVRSRDGIVHQIRVDSGMLGETSRDQLVACIVENLRNKVIVENGAVVAGYFSDGDQFKLPVTKWGCRKLVAKRMRDTAANAYWSEGFQGRVYNTAALISESNIGEAVKKLVPFLEEAEEFTLLTKSQIQTLIENALAARAIFNQNLCDDTATLFHRTNLRVNKRKILDEWRKIAKKSEHPVLAENVQILGRSKNFESAYDKFLKLVFEAISNREVAAEALSTTLSQLRDKTPKIKESNELSGRLNGLINRLKQPDFDDAAIYEAEDLIATIQEELAATETLSNFDQMPGDASGTAPLDGAAPEVAADAAGGGTPVININSPLIQIGGTSSGGEPPIDDAAMPETPPPPEEGGDEELDALLNGGGNAPAAGAAAGGAPPVQGGGGAPTPSNFGMESRNSKKPSINESRPVHYEMKTEADDDQADDESDRYALKKDEKVKTESRYINSYGTPIITDKADLTRIVNIMRRLAIEHKLTGKALKVNLESMAKASLKAIGVRIAEAKLPQAVDQIVQTFIESSKPFEGAAAPFGKKDDKKDGKKESKKPWESDSDSDSDESDDSDEGATPSFGKKKESSDDDAKSTKKPWKKPWEKDEDVSEDQYKLPLTKKRGFSRSSLENHVHESIMWGETQADAIKGKFGGVPFIFDHGGDDSTVMPVILSEDGQVEVPIPSELYDSAFAAANMMKGNDTPFKQWLSESIEQLRGVTDDDERAIAEATATINTSPDGTISVQVSDDIDVQQGEDGMMDDETGMDDGMSDETGMEGPVDAAMDAAGVEGEEDEMAPVDSIDTGEMGDEMGAEDGMETSEEEMPDFEAGGDEGMEAEAPMPPKKKPMLPPDDGMVEDKDITSPTNAKYTKHVKDNKRDMPTPKMPAKTDDSLEDIGPELKVDDGSGVNPPTAKKGTDD